MGVITCDRKGCESTDCYDYYREVDANLCSDCKEEFISGVKYNIPNTQLGEQKILETLKQFINIDKDELDGEDFGDKEEYIRNYLNSINKRER